MNGIRNFRRSLQALFVIVVSFFGCLLALTNATHIQEAVATASWTLAAIDETLLRFVVQWSHLVAPLAMGVVAYRWRREERLAVEAMKAQNDGKMRVALLQGPPGCGKTRLAEVVAQELGATFVSYLCHTDTSAEDLFVGVDVASAVAGEAHNVRQPGALLRAVRASHKGLTVLLLDEVDKLAERAENFLLSFLQSGAVPTEPGCWEYACVDRLWVFLTSNATRELSDAMMRRCRRVRMIALPDEVMIEVAKEETGVPHEVAKMALRRAKDLAGTEGTVLSVQEFSALCRDIWTIAQSADDVRVFFGQWVIRHLSDEDATKALRQVVTADIFARVKHHRRPKE